MPIGYISFWRGKSSMYDIDSHFRHKLCEEMWLRRISKEQFRSEFIILTDFEKNVRSCTALPTFFFKEHDSHNTYNYDFQQTIYSQAKKKSFLRFSVPLRIFLSFYAHFWFACVPCGAANAVKWLSIGFLFTSQITSTLLPPSTASSLFKSHPTNKLDCEPTKSQNLLTRD